jgi:hypothetical protein
VTSDSSTSKLCCNDEVYPDALGAERIPESATAGDFCRRFGLGGVLDLMDPTNIARLRFWKQQPRASFNEAIIGADAKAFVPGQLHRVRFGRVARPAFASCSSAATPTSPRASTWTLGIAPATSASFSASIERPI